MFLNNEHVMSLPELQASYYFELYEWVTKKEIKEYVSISEDCYGHKHIFPNLHINKENRVHGMKLYKFKSVNDVKWKLSEKVLDISILSVILFLAQDQKAWLLPKLFCFTMKNLMVKLS